MGAALHLKLTDLTKANLTLVSSVLIWREFAAMKGIFALLPAPQEMHTRGARLPHRLAALCRPDKRHGRPSLFSHHAEHTARGRARIATAGSLSLLCQYYACHGSR